jgi:hypothetical protein
MNMLKKVIVALAGISVFGMAQASNWVVLPLTSENSSYFMDSESVQKQSDGSVLAWFMQETSKPRVMTNGVVYTSSKSHNRYYCPSKQASLGPTIWYDRNGSVVASDYTYSSPRETVPDSVGEGLMRAACTAAYPQISSN